MSPLLASSRCSACSARGTRTNDKQVRYFAGQVGGGCEPVSSVKFVYSTQPIDSHVGGCSEPFSNLFTSNNPFLGLHGS